MKISDYIVEYLIEKGVTDIFGYLGGMVTHLMGLDRCIILTVGYIILTVW